MQRQIKLQGRQVGYVLKNSQRAKRMRLTVYCDGCFVVTRPSTLNINQVEKFIIQKAAWIINKFNYFSRFKNFHFLINSKSQFIKHKDQALVLAQNKVEYFNKFYGFSYNKISIKNQKTRWGSCSKKGNLNFNYKIIYLPEKVIDYTVVHELCHLKELNHSRKFWNLVAQALPDYLSIKRQLNEGIIK